MHFLAVAGQHPLEAKFSQLLVSVRLSKWKLVLPGGPKMKKLPAKAELYDLAADLGEKNKI